MPRRQFGSVRKREDGRWEIRISIGGKRCSYYASSKAAATTMLKELGQADITRQLSQPTSTTVAEFLRTWIEQAQLRPKTAADYREFTARHIEPTLGHLKLHQVKPVHIAQLDGQLLRSGRKATAEKVHQILRSALTSATTWGLIARNPAEGVRSPVADRATKSIWSLEQLQAFLAANDATTSRWRFLWTFLIASGLRIGEALALEWDDLQGGKVRVAKTVTRFTVDSIHVGPPKTRAGHRIVSLPPQVVGLLREWRQVRADDELRFGLQTELVFATERGTVPNLSILRRNLRSICSRASVPYIGIHGLRHVHASLLIAHGIDVKALQTRLGHSRASISLDIYSHLMPGRDELAARLLSDVFRGRPALPEPSVH